MCENFKSTGSKAVDQMLYVKIKGDVTPKILYKHIKKKDSGKTDFLAVAILSNIIYYHRPTVQHFEDGSYQIKKKFWGDELQKYYDDYAEMFDCSKRQITAAFDTLVYCGLVERHFRTITSNGMKMNNVMFLSLNVEKLIEILKDDSDYETEPVNDIVEKSVNFNSKQNRIEVSHKIETPVTKNSDTNTNITTKNHTDNITFFPSFNITQDITEERLNERAYRDILKENIELAALICEQPASKDQYLEYFEVMCDLVCHNRSPIKVKGNNYPAEVVRSQILKLRREHLEHVCDIYDNYCGEIKDFYRHCAATLYSSYFEVNNMFRSSYNMARTKICI